MTQKQLIRRIERERKRLGLTKADAAADAVPHYERLAGSRYWYQVVTGRKGVSNSRLVEMAAAVGITVTSEFVSA